MDLSLILPTRNRAESLRQTLESLARQDAGLPAGPAGGAVTYEVIVVDNGSTDETARVAEALRRTFPAPLRCIREPRTGKSVALNAGIQQAHGTWLVFLDDDVVAEPSWLAGLWRCLREQQADAVGGRVLPLWVDGRPAWMTDAVMGQLGALGFLDFGPQRLTMHPAAREYWWVGSNIALRRTLLERIGGFDERRIRGQDTELYARCVHAGATIVYEPAATVYHRTGRERLTPAYFRQWHQRAGYYRAYSVPWRRRHLITIMPLYCYRDMMRGAYQWLRAGWGPDAYWTRLSYECRLWASLSLFAHRLQLWPRWWLAVLTGRPMTEGSAPMRMETR